MENQNVTTNSAPDFKVFPYSTAYTRAKKTRAPYWTLDLIIGLLLLAAVGIAFMLRNVIVPGTATYVLFVLGLLAAVAVIYFIFKGALHHRTDAWFCSFAQRSGTLYHLEFSPRQTSGIFGAFGSLLDAKRAELSIEAAADPGIVELAISCAESGEKMPPHGRLQ